MLIDDFSMGDGGRVQIRPIRFLEDLSMRLHRGWGLATLAALLLGHSAAKADFTIDDFSTQQNVTTSTGHNPNNDAVAGATGIGIGTDRRIYVRETGSGRVETDVANDNPGFLNFYTLGTRSVGTSTITYDQTTNTGTNVQTSGPHTYDIIHNATGPNNTGLNINGFADHAGVTVTSTFYDINGHSMTKTVSLTPSSGDTYNNFFTYYNTYTGYGTVDLTKITAFQLTITDTQGSTNVSLDYISSAVDPVPPPMPTVPEPASFALVGLGMLTSGFVAYRRRKTAK
jgi:hypothetical protein